MPARVSFLAAALTLFAGSPAVALDPGDLIINEVMPNPAAVADSNGEWFEVYNPTLGAIEMQGLELQDNFGSHVITSSVVVPVQGYAVLGINADNGLNGGVIVDYEYSGLFLANSGDQVRILDGFTVVSEMSYGSSISGRSRALRCALLPTVSANYSSTPTSITYGDGDAGTPGSYNQFEPDFDDDGLGDSCDACVADADNDSDMDGLCGDVTPGDILINEVQPDPTVVADRDGEWFEVINVADVDLDLAGLTMTDEEGSHVILASVVVPAGGVALLAVSDPLTVPGGTIVVDYEYPYCTSVGCNGMALANGGDSVTLLNGATVIDSFAWDEPPDNRGLSYARLCEGGFELTANISPGERNAPDSDGDGIEDPCDICPLDPENDADGDGFCADEDLCPDTVADDPSRLNPNHWALFDVAGGEFETVIRGRGKGPGLSFSTEDTGGCTCAQIVEELGAGMGHLKHGCSNSLMLEWTTSVAND